MKKYLIILMLFVITISLFSDTFIVKQDGTGDYSVIQMAVENSAANDTILVYPGTYYENVDLTGKDITLGSLNMITNDSTYISTTIIDGNYSGSCILILDSNNTSIIGFTLQHGSGTIYPNSFPSTRGGGINVRNSTAKIENNIIKDNISRAGGGICSHSSIVQLSGNIITKNHATFDGGGISAGVNSIIEFSEDNLNSIYLNSAGRGNDISIAHNNLNIILDKFTVMEPDNFYIAPIIEASYEFSCEEAAIEPVEADLYVDTNGNDNNSGLSSDDPLQTMTYALIKIKADSLHPHIIHIADGIYSPSLTNELFPLNMKSYISLVGESEENTIIDGENGDYQIMLGFDSELEVGIKNLTIKNLRLSSSQRSPIDFAFTIVNEEIIGFSTNLENLTIENLSPRGFNDMILAIGLGNPIYAHATNITLKNNTSASPLGISGRNFYGENIKIVNTHSNHGNSFGGGLIVTNALPTEGEVNKFVNLEISNNENTMTDWPASWVIAVYSGNRAIISNATITDNHCQAGYGGAITVEGAELTLINSIVHNNTPYPAQLREDGTYGPATLTVDHCLFTNGQDNIMTTGECNLNWEEGNIEGNPEFVNSGNYPFQLSSFSPCIDAGTMDLPEGITLSEYDLAGNPRIVNGMVDMGAYEYQGDTTDDDEIPKPVISSLNIYPNPFMINSPRKTELKFELKLIEDGNIKLEIYNVKGQKVYTLMDAFASQGSYLSKWNGKNNQNKLIATGTYFARFTLNNKVTQIRKFIVVK